MSSEKDHERGAAHAGRPLRRRRARRRRAAPLRGPPRRLRRLPAGGGRVPGHDGPAEPAHGRATARVLRSAIMARVATHPAGVGAAATGRARRPPPLPAAVRGAGPGRGRRGDRAGARHRLDQLAPGARPPGGRSPRCSPPPTPRASTWAARADARRLLADARPLRRRGRRPGRPAVRPHLRAVVHRSGRAGGGRAVPHGRRPGHEGAARTPGGLPGARRHEGAGRRLGHADRSRSCSRARWPRPEQPSARVPRESGALSG